MHNFKRKQLDNFNISFLISKIFLNILLTNPWDARIVLLKEGGAAGDGPFLNECTR